MRRVLCSIVACLPALAACNRIERDGPPDVRAGRDECRECGMIINEERSSAALIVSRDGHRDPMLFDDIGCMLDAEEETVADPGVAGRFVHDHTGGTWVAAAGAVFLLADRAVLPTPMGSGIAAFADRAGAEAARERFGGELLDYAGLRAARRAQMSERYGRPGG